MLESLEIENLAVIKHNVINFGSGLNIFTGETGAGKSVVLSGIRAILGMRVNREIIRHGEKSAVVTAVFSTPENEIKDFLLENDLASDDDSLIIRREIHSDGKQRAKVNFRPVTLSVLKNLGLLLINIHGQHDNQILLRPEAHLSILDDFGENGEVLEDYKKSFHELQSVAKELKAAKDNEKRARERLSFYKEQYDDINSLKIEDPGEEDRLENEQKAATMAEDIIKSYNFAADALDNGSSGSADMINNAKDFVSDFTDIKPETTALLERLESAAIEIRDIADSLRDIASTAYVDEERLGKINDRLAAFDRLKRKYLCEFEDLIPLRNEAEKKLEGIEGGSERIKELSEKRNNLLNEVTEKAKKLTAMRERAAEKFSTGVKKQLEFLNMPNCEIKVELKKGNLTVNGMESAEILISANPGEPPKSIAKIASGGELSRIMLGIKTVIAKRDHIPTLIFDEIDTGVSGEAAEKIGLKLHELSKSHQIICVTHLSQIASLADNHFLIEKHIDENTTETSVTLLDRNGRIKEISRIIGGADPGENVRKAAEEELKKASEILSNK